jgi:hypothetical protein
LVSAIVRVILPLPKLPKLPKHRVGTREIFFNMKHMESSDPAAKSVRAELNQRGVPAQDQIRMRLWFPTDAVYVHMHSQPYFDRNSIVKNIA